jgi:enoyl-[acyl-carrier protein] reductase II
VATPESSAHQNFKQAIIQAGEGDTQLALKQLTPVRLIKNDFFKRVNQAELNGASTEELTNLLGRGRAKKGMFEGDLTEGELEIGQISAGIKEIKPAAEILDEIYDDFIQTINNLKTINP